MTCVGIPVAARAFTEPRTYAEEASKGGGGGRWFTGSPAEGHGCSVCHTGARAASLEVVGLPAHGYVPGKRYDVRIAWPEFAARAETLRKRDEGPPSMGLVAELVAESGAGAGVVEIDAAEDAASGELCVVPEGQPATQLFGVRPVDQTTEEGTHCEANELGERCLVAVLSCGARELRLRWTAPVDAQGTIWFAAGFVTTEHARSDVEDDAVAEVVIPLVPVASASERHATQLEGGCSVSRPTRAGGDAARAWGAVLCVVLACVRARRQTRRERVRP